MTTNTIKFMDVRFINPFIVSLVSIFKEMAGITMEKGTLRRSYRNSRRCKRTGFIRISRKFFTTSNGKSYRKKAFRIRF